ncbi:unnamed protein product [Symbiodinium sp. CCMP2592]|nr:unnamed protein product [Symbiodinium sp. CCMP2592]
MSRPPATSRKVRLLALFLVSLRATQTARALLGAGAVPFPRSVPPGIWAHNLLARRAKADGTLDGGEAEDKEDIKAAKEKDDVEEAKAGFDQGSRIKAVDEAASAQTADPVEDAKQDLDAAKRQRNVALRGLERAEALAEYLQKQLLELEDSSSEKAKQAKKELKEAETKLKEAETKLEKAKKELSEAEQKYEAKASVQAGRVQAIKAVSGKDLQNLRSISGPNVTIEDWMVGLGRCGEECLKDIQTNAPKSDCHVDRVPPLMLSRCMRGGKTTFLAYLFKLVKAESGYLPIFISFNGISGIQRKKGESRLQTILRAIAVTLLSATPTDTQSVSCDEDTLSDHLDRQNGIIVLMIDELNLLVPKGTRDDEVASFLRKVFLIRENRYLVFTTHEPFDGSQITEYIGGYSPRGVIARDLPRSVNLTEQRGIPECRALSAGNLIFFSGIPSLLRSWKQQYNFQARFQQLTKPDTTPDLLLQSFVREFLKGERLQGDAIRAFDCLTATSDQGEVRWILCYAAQMCSYLNQRQLADWINRLQIDASDPLSGKGWEVLVVLAAAFRCLDAMACGDAGHPLLGLPPNPSIKACYFLDVPSEVSTLDAALEWWAGQDIPPTFPLVAVLNPLCSTFEVFDCILLYQREELGVRHVRGFQQKAGNTYPGEADRQDKVDCVWMQGKAAEHRRSEQAKGWTLPSSGEIRAFLGAALRDLFPKELDT